MIEREGRIRILFERVAVKAIYDYAQHLLSVDALLEQMYEEWQRVCKTDEHPTQDVLTRIAQRICSYALCMALRSSQLELRNYAFDNLRCYLHRSLRNSSYAVKLQRYDHGVEDVVHQVLEDFYRSLMRNPLAGPDDPGAFLKWWLVVLFRHARTYVQKSEDNHCDSLEERHEEFAEQFIDERNSDLHRDIDHQELQQVLKGAILLLRNPRYRQVLLYTYLEEMDEAALASLLEVDIQDIYLWRYRALRALRKNKEILQALQAWRE